jgi:hypothetical protein
VQLDFKILAHLLFESAAVHLGGHRPQPSRHRFSSFFLPSGRQGRQANSRGFHQILDFLTTYSIPNLYKHPLIDIRLLVSKAKFDYFGWRDERRIDTTALCCSVFDTKNHSVRCSRPRKMEAVLISTTNGRLFTFRVWIPLDSLTLASVSHGGVTRFFALVFSIPYNRGFGVSFFHGHRKKRRLQKHMIKKP